MRHHLLVATVASAGLLLASACNSSGAPERVTASVVPSAQVQEPPTREGAVVAAEIVDTDFAPVTTQIEAGERVRWEQVGDQPHSVTAADESFDSSPDCGPLDSDRCLGMGDTFVHAFETPGTFAYYCRVHGLPDGTGMAGTVVVK